LIAIKSLFWQIGFLGDFMEIKVGAVYRHYKGKDYQVKAVVKHSETLEDLVLYDCLYENKLAKTWVRPIENFTGRVEIDGKAQPRFQLLDQ
jgi:hypothetical protein